MRRATEVSGAVMVGIEQPGRKVNGHIHVPNTRALQRYTIRFKMVVGSSPNHYSLYTALYTPLYEFPSWYNQEVVVGFSRTYLFSTCAS